jgi:hypothetical protein
MWSSRLELRLQGHQRKNGRDLLTEGGRSRKVVGMRSVAIIFCAALLVALPTISRAQYNDSDQQDPKEYHDEDSQPLSLAADLLYPIGYGIEWLVARPMHWFATDSPAAPIYRPVGGRDMSPPPPVPIIPDNTMDQATVSTTPQDWSPTRTTVTTTTTTVKQVVPLATPPPSSAQPALH